MKKNTALLCVMLVCFVSCTAGATDFSQMIADSLPVVEYPMSLNEQSPFQELPLSEETFMTAVQSQTDSVMSLLAQAGLNTSLLPSIPNQQVKRFSFLDVPIAGKQNTNISIILVGPSASCSAFVFLTEHGGWVLTDVLPYIETVGVKSNGVNTWLTCIANAFGDSVQTESLYSLSDRKYETSYIAHAASAAFGEGITDGIVYNSAYSTISEYSVVEDAGTVSYCHLYIVRNTSLCNVSENALTELSAETEIDVYTYDYSTNAFSYLQTNRIAGVGAATIDNNLQADRLLENIVITKK